MKIFALAASALALAGCTDRESSPPPAPQRPASTAPAATPAPPASRPFTMEEKNDLLDFSYSYSVEAAAVPALVARFAAQIDKIRADLTKAATADREFRRKEGFDFNGYDSQTDHQTAGQSPSLLSLESTHSEFTGGAHPNHGTTALLWDRRANREVAFAELFTDPADRDRLLNQRWCDALNVEREKRRGEPVGGDDMFAACPKMDEIAIIPADRDRDGRFDQLRLVASPYVAGPYAEGDYDIELGLTPAMIAAIKPTYREDFGPAQPQ